MQHLERMPSVGRSSPFIILMAVLQPLAGDEALADPAGDEIIGSDGRLGAFGHGEPSCS